METGIHELTAGYALDALDLDERFAYEAHLGGCERCQEELESFWTTTEALAVATSGPAPSVDLRQRILAGVRTEPQVVVPFAPRRRPVVAALSVTSAVAAAAAIAVAVWATSLSGRLDDSRTALDRERSSAAILADPDARSVALQSGAGRLVVDADGHAVLVLDELAPAPTGKTYELWIVADDRPVAAGVFAARDGRAIAGVEGNVPDDAVVAVTVEKAGGVTIPSAPPLVSTEPV